MIWVIVIAGVITIGASIIFYSVAKSNKNLNKYLVQPNSENIQCALMTKFTHGHKSGRIIRKEECKNGTIRIVFLPDDNKEGDDENIKIETEKFIVSKEKVRILKGNNSRDTIMIVSKNILDYPQEIRDSADVKAYSVEAMRNYLEVALGKQLLENSDKALEELLKEWNRTGLTEMTLKKIKEDREKEEELKRVEKKEEKSEDY